jgi:hypothetical protein
MAIEAIKAKLYTIVSLRGDNGKLMFSLVVTKMQVNFYLAI